MSYHQTVLANCMACGEDRPVPGAPDYPPVCASCCEKLVAKKERVEIEEGFLRRIIAQNENLDALMREIQKYLDVLDALRGGGKPYVHTREREEKDESRNARDALQLMHQLRRERDQARCDYAWELSNNERAYDGPYPRDFVIETLQRKYGLDEDEARRLAEESKR